jgi:hypothetical protein
VSNETVAVHGEHGVRPSPWMQKAYALMTDRRLPVRSLSKYLHNAILKDSQKCRTLDAQDVSNIAPRRCAGVGSK